MTQRLVITCFDSGRHVLPPIRFPFVAGERADTIATRPLYLDVLTMPLDSTQNFADIKPVYGMPIGWDDVWPWLLVAGLLLLVSAAAGFGVYAFIRRRNNKPVFGASRPKEPPHATALRELDRLRGEKLWQSGRVKEYYTRLSDIVRTYVEGRFGVPAMEMTRDEILAGLRSAGFEDNNLVDRLWNLFSLSDMVKFAKAEPPANENETSLLDSYLFVNNTKIETPVAEESAQALNQATGRPAEKMRKALKIKGTKGAPIADIIEDTGKGGRFVYYSYCISVIFMTFRLRSAVYYVHSGQSPLRRGWPFLVISALFGWWGIPWGPIYTAQAIYIAIRGKDVTNAAIKALTLHLFSVDIPYENLSDKKTDGKNS
jgi:hypothetical protein